MENRRDTVLGRIQRRSALLAVVAGLYLLPSHVALAQQAADQAAEAEPAPAPPPGPEELPALMAPAPAPVQAPAPEAAAAPDAAEAPPDTQTGAASAADDIADIFSKVGDQLYEDCIFDLSEEQVEVRAALIQAYVQQGASSASARRLAAVQIQAPKLSAKCEAMRRTPEPAPPPEPEPPPADWSVTTVPTPVPAVPPKPVIAAAPKPKKPDEPPPVISIAGKKMLPQWDCADGVDYVTIHISGSTRKLTGGEICSPFEDVVHEVPASLPSFRLGYTIKTGRLFIIADGSEANGRTIAWGLSGRDVCRNNPDPDCFAARAIGPLPPGEYSFAAEKERRVSWGPRTKRHVVGIYLRKLWNKDRFSPGHTKAILARGNIAIHVRLKGEMSEACIGLEPKGWAYVASLVKDGRANGINVYIDEPHPQIAEAPPVIVASSFSLTSLFK